MFTGRPVTRSPAPPLFSRLATARAISYGALVPVRPRGPVTTDELMAVSGSDRDTLYQWVARRLLPRPGFMRRTDDGQLIASWPLEALERVRFIAAKRQHLTLDEITALLQARPPRR